jgi:hypothetical protein
VDRPAAYSVIFAFFTLLLPPASNCVLINSQYLSHTLHYLTPFLSVIENLVFRLNFCILSS